MGKLLILIVLIVVAAWLVRRALGRMNASADRPTTASSAGDELVRCVHCGLLLPRTEARESAGAIYCSEEHARLGPARGRR